MKTRFKKIPILLSMPVVVVLFGLVLVNAEEKEVGSEPQAERVKLIYSADKLRDPFKSYIPTVKKPEAVEKNVEVVEKKEVTLPSFSVQGVVWGSKIPQAIIDNTVVKIGDTIKGAQIIDIKKEYIEVLYKDKDFTIPTTFSKSSNPGTFSREDR